MPTRFDELPWWQKAELQRTERERWLRQNAERRLRRIEDAARRRLAFEALRFVSPSTMLDSDRLSGTLSERLGARGVVQLVLWGLMSAVGACVLVSFFTAPLMELDLAVKAVLAAALLALSYIL